jgi:hypothetical protein
MAAEDEQGAVVIDIVARLQSLPADDGKPPPLVSERVTRCHHWRHTATIDRNARTLTCNKCEADLDPYDFIDRLADDGTRLVETRRRYQALVKTMNERLSEDKRIKARVRAWRKKQGA